MTKSITRLSKRYPKVGRLNGWLSNHAHWGYDAHIKAISEKPGYAIKASTLFKGCSYVALIAFTEFFVKILSEELEDYVAWEVVSKELGTGDNVAGFNFEDECEILKSMFLPFYPDIGKLG